VGLLFTGSAGGLDERCRGDVGPCSRPASFFRGGYNVAMMQRATEPSAWYSTRLRSTGALWGRPRAARDTTTYATWPMRVATHVCYASWRECGPLAAVDAENRSLRKGSTPPRSHVVTDLLSPGAARRLATARGLW
jgi:hypothetical protein